MSEIVAVTGSQISVGKLRIGVFTAVTKDDERVAALLVRTPSASERVELRIRESYQIEGHGTLTLIDLWPATQQDPGVVKLSWVAKQSSFWDD